MPGGVKLANNNESKTNRITFSYKNLGLAVLIIAFLSLSFSVFTSLYKEIEDQSAEIEALKIDLEGLSNEKARLNNFIAELEEQISSEITGKEKDDIIEVQGLVEVRDIDSNIQVNLYYATEDNFTGQVLYPVEVCLLRKGTAEKLAAANAEFMRDGYRIKVWDGFRPQYVQHKLWEIKPNPRYVADPAVGSNHNRGAAVDVTLVDAYGNKLEMPTGFDDFEKEASRSYSGMSKEAKENMEYLTEVMVRNGFTPIQSEWWHFNDADIYDYDFHEITLEEFVSEYFSR